MRSVPHRERWALSITTIMLICCGIQPGLISSAPTAPTGTLVRRMVGEIDEVAKLEPLKPLISLPDTDWSREEGVGTIEELVNEIHPAEKRTLFHDWLKKQAEKKSAPIQETSPYYRADLQKYLDAWKRITGRTLHSEFLEQPIHWTSYLHDWEMELPHFIDRYLPSYDGYRTAFINKLSAEFKPPEVKTAAEFLKRYGSFAMEYLQDKGFLSIPQFLSTYIPAQPLLITPLEISLVSTFGSGGNILLRDLMNHYLNWVVQNDV
ncbi:hypothetical protein CROQUDRAFT_640854 [Cronartium quercuum f. sp. fusiforme G11]|uniref:Uncharacterized protein n=1 Tax=Cronartium quercuum f. sp. fusiforme G11 TaxID=708437 RepID=A0A9P6T9Z7_9BASI|nr:hypothetical protein CROQUDRAFT_640854 [Cronartium quercuum f. sp. fusiforme G11]